MKSNIRMEGDAFHLNQYNNHPAFSDFFPALAGVTGKPMWVFFTNRGQGIAGFGINNKDGAMMEFQPANKAYHLTPSIGFRTFIQSAGKYWEPFSIPGDQSHQNMVIRPWEMEINDKSPLMGLDVNVTYFGLPNDDVPALVRKTTIKNNSSKTQTIQVTDGLARVIPWGMNDYLSKNMSRTIEAFAEVKNHETGVPLFKLKIEPHDRPEIRWLKGGFFSFALREKKRLNAVVDPQIIFGEDSSLSTPFGIIKKPLKNPKQLNTSITPCSFFSDTLVLKAHESKSVVSFYGFVSEESQAAIFAEKVQAEESYFEGKRQEMEQVYRDLVSNLGFTSNNNLLNRYANGCFMDNVLRGGLPIEVGSNKTIVHVFSRKHGDMERDYNAFQVSATYYSQGNGNFRDVNQNRRNDILISGHVGATNIETFFNALQFDGYNPLVINPIRFQVSREMTSKLDLQGTEQCKTDFQKLFREPVLLGQIYEFIHKHSADPMSVSNQFKDAMAFCTPQQNIQHGEGYWVDHWIYNLDHLEQYLNVFPDKKSWLLFEKQDFTYYDSDHFIQPRKEKYIITKEGKFRQYGSVVKKAEKETLISSRLSDQHKVRIEGTGPIFKTNLFIKLLQLSAIKLATLDPFGVGIEMEADKPGWCDALNGAPGMFGSSTHEMYQTHRLILFLQNEVLPFVETRTLDIPQEVFLLIKDVTEGLEMGAGKDDFRPAWNKLATAREHFRNRTFMGLSGRDRNIKMTELTAYITKADETLKRAHKKAMDPKTGIPTSYFTYDVDVHKLDDGWRQMMDQLPWTQHRVPAFLEGSVHALKLSAPAQAKQIYNAVKKSPLFDQKLGMYKLNTPLTQESDELGRVKIFSPGWLENESIFLHMHYKYLLALFKAGLTETFFEECEKGLVAFRDPTEYGRPTFQNSSFIASSSFSSSEVHGRGYVARLSGATCEFLSMIYFAVLGDKFFKLENGTALFQPDPKIPKEWFTEKEAGLQPKHSFAIKLFGVPVVFVNQSRKNTFGSGASKIIDYEWILDGRFYSHKGKALTPEASVALREGRLENLTINLK
ncbi:MAG: hypothetical protein ACKVQC_00840 [Elusimicrobiota bacterium]